MLRTRLCPHLAFVEPELFDEVNDMIRRRNANYRRAKEGQADSRKGLPKKRTIWPAQHMRCGVCGRPMVCNGPKNRRVLMCAGATQYSCWNSVALNLSEASGKLSDAVLDAIAALPDFEDVLRDTIGSEGDALIRERDGRRHKLEQDLADVDRQIGRVADAIAKGIASDSLLTKITQLEFERDELKSQLRELLKRPAPELKLPPIDELKCLAREALGELAAESAEYGRLMERLVPSLCVYPYRIIDEGKVVLRAAMQLDIGALVPALAELPSVGDHLRRGLVVDLFEPPQRERYRAEIWRLSHSEPKLQERTIAAQLGVTQPVVQRAKKLQRQLDALGRPDAYLPLYEPPVNGRLHRHKHPRYGFSPLPGFPVPWPET